MSVHHSLVTRSDTAGSARRLAWLETMKLIRAYEEKLVELQQQGVAGTCTSVGQEACAVGVVSALEARDRILTNHRSAGHLIARGADIGRLFAEVLGREDGYCRGRGGSLHISAAELGVVLTSTIVGGELSMAPGVALAQKMGKGEAGAITAVFFGDGAACEGIFHEALNLAVQWELPLLFVCEDNHWQGFVHRDETMPEGAIPRWAHAHSLPVVSVDGNDVDAISDAASRAVAGIRETGRPAFLHLVTYRQRGHFEPDDQAYVDPAELARWTDADPIRLLEARLSADERQTTVALDAVIAARIEGAVTFAQASPWPSTAQLRDFTYA
jgi:acetoin:2,6-dichlorophenolindophenol oxidoreductase subunit alpha